MLTTQEMPKAELEWPNSWLIDGWLPFKNRILLSAPQGSCKTRLTCWVAVNIASGNSIFGHKVKQGHVLISDEETPVHILTDYLNRFCKSLGFSSYTELPITVRSFEGFNFGRTTLLKKELEVIKDKKPVLIILESFVAMLPGKRQGLCENDSGAGIALKDDLAAMLSECNWNSTILLTTHTTKPVGLWNLKQLTQAKMQDCVSGHPQIVGQACDTGLVLKKFSETPAETLRFAIITKVRRAAIPMAGEVVYVEMEEEAYGKGWARLKQVAPIPTSPSELARRLYRFFLDGKLHSEKDIIKESRLHSPRENRISIDELLSNKVIFEHENAFTYYLNPNYENSVNKEYLQELKKVT
jgi:hypothetical protein